MQTQPSFRIITTQVTQTIALGQLLGSQLQRGDIVLLSGNLGAGKTHFAKGIVAGTGSHDTVTSPTFAFMNEYRTAMRTILYHIDLYRITDAAELDSIGIVDATAGHGIALIEWPERDHTLQDIPHLAVEMTHLSPTSREIIGTAHGVRAQHIITYINEHWRLPEGHQSCSLQ